ncbi:MAG: AAA family ATPase [Sphingobacteriales bacterium]|jgi:shikimate kinase|nr:AAA family ATPase [Sphingobacteriales bacterium]
MVLTKPIFLIGFMGSGKSTVGRSLGALTGTPFTDLDEEIAMLHPQGITGIFQESGEARFRELETIQLRSITTSAVGIVATGGGCPVHSNNLEWMNETGTTIYLKCRPGILFHRLAKEKNGRPLLKDLSDLELMETINSLLKSRHVVYEKASIHVDGHKTADEICKSILQQMNAITSS